jgi:hypothetical protein
MNNIDDHRKTPQISIDQHVRHRVIELGQRLAPRLPVYLDTKFWIILRKAALDPRKFEEGIELLNRLRSAVANGVISCPISESIFFELMKQSDAGSRLATARLIDELSLGVTLVPHQTRVATELARFLHLSEFGEAALDPLNHLIWSKLTCVLGFVHPSVTPFDRDTELAVQKAFFDHMWTLTLEQMVTQIGDMSAMEDLHFSNLAQTLNVGVAKHAEELRSFKQTLAAELEGATDVCGDLILEIVSDIAVKKDETPVEPDSAQWSQLRPQWTRLLARAMQDNPSTRHHIRTLYIEASLHAGFRWDKRRRFTGNDIYDFHHADAALAYCRAFFTERPLKALIQDNNLALDKLYDCDVFSEVPDAISYLAKLTAQA